MTERTAVGGWRKAIGWSAAQSWAGQAVRLLAVIVMARLLVPAEFGLYAMAAAIIAGLQLLVGQGLSAAITQRPDLEDAHVSAALLRMLAGSAVLTLAVLAGAGALAEAIRQPALAPVLRVLSASFAINAVSALGLALHKRRVDLKRVAAVTLAAEVVGAAAGIALAWRGAGVWSLVARQLCVSAVSALLAWVLMKGQGWARPARRHFTELAGSARRIAAGNALVLVRDRLDEAVIGALLGAEAVGLYALARRQVEALTSLIPAVIQNAGWALFAAQQADPAALRTSLERAVTGMSALAWPAYAAFAASAGLWAPLVLGPQWAAAAPLIMGLAVAAAVRAAVGLQLIALVATGGAGRRLVLEVLATAVVYAAMLIASAQGEIVTVVFAAALATTLLAPIEMAVIARGLPLDLRSTAGLFGRGLLAAAATVGAIWLVLRLPIGPTPLMALAAAAAGAAAYLIALRLVFPQVFSARLSRLRAAEAAAGG